MSISVVKIIDQIRFLEVGVVFPFINESNKNRIKIVSIDSDFGPIRLERLSSNGDQQAVVVSENNLAKIAAKITENEPFSIDAIVSGSGNWRSVFESALAHAPEFYYCKVNDQKRLVWCPGTPHVTGELKEIDYALLPRKIVQDSNTDSLLEEFQYFIENCTKSPNSFRNYSSGLNVVTIYIKEFEPQFTSFLDYTDDVYLQTLYNKLMTVSEFVENDGGAKGKTMYSNSFQSYLMFLRARKYFSKKLFNSRLKSVAINVDSIYRSFITAIHSKPFILLAGISGTGKSRIVRELARSCDKIDDDPWSVQSPVNYCMIPVKPNWHDSTDLIGYASGISGKTEYVVTDFLRFLTLAWFYQDVPFFLCLDEMNLAPVEQYFAEFLSVIESRKLRDGKIVTDPILCLTSWDKTGDKVSIQILEDLFNNIYVNAATEASEALPRIDKLKEQFLNSGISIPQNLIVMGTVNMDETTFTFSRKVLDRAMTIEMNEVDLRGGLQEDLETFEVDASQLIADAVEGKDIYSENKDECDTILLYLETVNEALRGTPFGIAYRTRNEFLLYVIENLKYKGNHSKEFCMARALDEITSMKILSRIEGDDTRLRMPDGGTLLKHLQKVISGALQTVLAGYVPNAEAGESLMVCHGKLEEMDGKLLNGYCTFWT